VDERAERIAFMHARVSGRVRARRELFAALAYKRRARTR
jgi:hypothetical protein